MLNCVVCLGDSGAGGDYAAAVKQVQGGAGCRRECVGLGFRGHGLGFLGLASR